MVRTQYYVQGVVGFRRVRLRESCVIYKESWASEGSDVENLVLFMKGDRGLRKGQMVRILCYLKGSWASEGSDCEDSVLFTRGRGLRMGQMVRIFFLDGIVGIGRVRW